MATQNGVVGDNYLGNFTIGSSAGNTVTLSAPNFTRGRTQHANLPANSATGFPIKISTAQGISGVDFQLHYNPQLLAIHSVTLGPEVSGSLTYNNLLPGVLFVTVSSAGQLSATSGALSLVNIQATVPLSAPYAAKHVLNLANLHVYDASANPIELPSLDDDGLHVAAFFGDANGSQTHNGPDATNTQDVIVGNERGLAEYPLVDPWMIVDINGNELVQSDDVTEIQRAIVGLSTTDIPAVPSLAVVPSTGPDPLVSIPQNLSANVGQTITVPVELLVTEPTGIELAGVDLAIAYDATRLELNDVQLGELLVGFGMNVNLATPGVIRISMTASSPLELPFDDGGVLAELNFNVLTGSGPTRVNLLGNAESLHTALYDDLGRSLLLQPAPTNDDDDSVDGIIETLAIDQVAGLSP